MPDFRALDISQTVKLECRLPHAPLDPDVAATRFFRVDGQAFDCYSRREIRSRFGTKLHKGVQFYAQQLRREQGADTPVLDLGCGSGGTRRYLQSLGFTDVLAVDWFAPSAEALVDAHRLPLAAEAFGLVISTAVFEHLHNPLLATLEVARLLRSGGIFLGGVSFWESWHDGSYFHFTPDGLNALCEESGLLLEDVWAGWGVIPASLTHYLPGLYHSRGIGRRFIEPLRDLGYLLQYVLEQEVRFTAGAHRLRGCS